MSPDQKGYHGETINIKDVLYRTKVAASEHGWQQEVFYDDENFEFLGLKRIASNTARRVYISTGIHGDEPAGPLSVLKLLEDDFLLRDISCWICPCLNPFGFTKNTRENKNGIDLNREYKKLVAPETAAHVKWLEKQPTFDLTLCIHEDWESKGFYLFTQPHHAEKGRAILQAVEKVFPVDHSPTIEGFNADHGLLTPGGGALPPDAWPEAFYLEDYKGGSHFTLETASAFELEKRVGAHIAAVKAAIKLV